MPALKKSELIQLLEENGVAVPKNLTIPELQTLVKRMDLKPGTPDKGFDLKTDPMSGLGELKKQALIRLSIDLGHVPMKGETKGDLLLWIRSNLRWVSASTAR